MANNTLNITPEFLRALAVVKKANLFDLHKDLGIDNFYSYTYFQKIVTGIKPVSDKFKNVVNDLINEQLTTAELIKAIKLSEIIQ